MRRQNGHATIRAGVIAVATMATAVGGYIARPAAYAGAAVPVPVAITVNPGGSGWWTLESDGTVLPGGGATAFPPVNLHARAVGIAATADGGGYWVAAVDGEVAAVGDASFHGSAESLRLVEPIAGIAADPATGGYWLVASDGGIFSYGAPFFGSIGGRPLVEPIVGMQGTQSGKGYRFVAADGGVFAFGDAAFYGSIGGHHLASPVIGIANTPDDTGYWLVSRDGTIRNFGGATPITTGGIHELAATTAGAGGLVTVAPDGGVRTLPGGSPPSVGSATQPASLFIQISSLAPSISPALLNAWMAALCRTGSRGDLVLQDVARADGVLLTDYLDIVEPYLPGGTRPCFARVFVGTVDLAWEASGSKYVEGIGDQRFIDRYMGLSSATAQAFSTRYPRIQLDWYLTYEANLNDLYYPDVESAYATMLKREIQTLSAIRSDRSFMWSPAFWYPYSIYSQNTAGMAQLSANLTALFRDVAKTGHLPILNLQDFIGGSSCQPKTNQMTPADAVAWVRFINTIAPRDSAEINVEQYRFDCATQLPHVADPTEIAQIERFYASRGVTLGPAFELRYWMRTHSII